MDVNHLLPAPAPNGLFEPVIGMAPAAWPWALPHIYAANVVAARGDIVTGGSADPNGSFTEETSRRTDLGRVEIIGFWGGEFHVVDSEAFAHVEGAKQAAKAAFDTLPVRLLMECGRVTEENAAVDVTGTWPEQWTFVRLQDLGVLCAFLHDSAVSQGAGERAEQFRALVRRAWPATEQLLVYIEALKGGRDLLWPFLSRGARSALKEGLKIAQKWLR